MATLKVTYNIIECDGCDERFGSDAPFRTPMEARAEAYAKGWRFPAMIDSKGNALGNTVSDVCPECSVNWTPVPRSGPRARALRTGEAL